MSFRSKLDAAWEISGRYPISVHWDVTESRLLSCEAQISDDHEETDKKRNKNAKRITIERSFKKMKDF